MPNLNIAAKWDDGTNVGVRCYEVVNVKGENVTFPYEAEVPKAGKSGAQIRAALVAAIKAQRDARLASQPAHADVDLGGDTLAVN